MQQAHGFCVKNTFFDEEINVHRANCRPKWNRSCSHDSLLNQPVVSPAGSSLKPVTCEKCKQIVACDDQAVLILPESKRVIECTQLETREAKHCHEKCINSWNAHPKECKPCIDWHKKGR